MAPQSTTSSQELLAQAAQKLSTAIKEAGTAPNDFAKNLLELLEVSTKIDQFDEMASAANAEATSDEAQKWREISLMTMQHARKHLIEQQKRVIDQLHGASENGASLYKDAHESVKPVLTAAKPPAGMLSEVKLGQAVQPPPGLAAPPGLTCPATPSKKTVADTPKLSTLPAHGLRPPPGLASAGTAKTKTTLVSPPPGFAFQKGQKPRQQATGYPKKTQVSETNKTSLFEARFGNEITGASAMVNLDAYESE